MIGYIILGLVALFFAVILIRTLTFKPKAQPAISNEEVNFDSDAAVHALSELVKCKTISYNDHALEDDAEFQKLIDMLPTLYPKVFEVCSFDQLPDRALLLRWPGKSDKEPAVMMAHYDVVPVNEENWEKPPFAAIIEDGVMWGRGTLDTKVTFNAVFSAANHLIAKGFVPENDIYFAFSGGEEVNGKGAPNIVQYFADHNITPGIVVDEGGAVVDRPIAGMDREYAVIGVTEKGYMDLKISAKGTGGHSSTPPRNTPAARLFAFANEIEKKRPFKKHLIPEVYEMFSAMAPSFSFGMRMLLGNLWLFKPLLIAIMPMVSPFGEAILSTTCCFTMMKGSDACNVIPKEPYLVANLRTSVHQNCEESLAVLKKYADKYDLEIENSFFVKISLHQGLGFRC